MHSRVRGALESTLRGLAMIALALLTVHAFRALRTAPPARATGDQIDTGLAQWSTHEIPPRVHVTFDTPPDAQTRDWLAALTHAGTEVAWSGTAPIAAALAVQPVPDPQRSSRVWFAGPAGTRVDLEDELGFIDSLRVARLGARAVLPQLTGVLRAAGDVIATSALRDSLVLRPVLVLANAGWEAKFAIAALEEHGWKVDARLKIAPSGDVRQGESRLVIDTAGYTAIIVLDDAAARYAASIISYVRAGGGLVASGEGARLPALQSVLPANAATAPSLPSIFTAEITRTAPRAALALASLTELKPNAVALETRLPPVGSKKLAAAAWRVGNGRVVQIGYHDTWRWRMAGGEADPIRAHREWWAALISSVAYAPRVPLNAHELLEPTPLVSHIAALGPPVTGAPSRASILNHPGLKSILFGILIVALLLEWTSRRLRGKL